MFYTTIESDEADTIIETIDILLPEYAQVVEALDDLRYDTQVTLSCAFSNRDEPKASVHWGDSYRASFDIPLKFVIGNYTPALNVTSNEYCTWCNTKMPIVLDGVDFDVPARLVSYCAYRVLVRLGERIVINDLNDLYHAVYPDGTKTPMPPGAGARRTPEEYFFIAFGKLDRESGYICQNRPDPRM